MPLVEITDYHAEHLYEYSFDQMIDTFKPLKDKEDKRYIQAYKYPLIYRVIPTAMHKEYPSLSKTSIQIYATRLGLSILSHDDRIKSLQEMHCNVSDPTNEDGLFLCDSFIQKLGYPYATPMSDNGKTYLSTTEEMMSFISEHVDAFGLPEYQIGLAAFFLGADRATLNTYLQDLVKKEIVQFWRFVDKRSKSLKSHSQVVE
jgi:hypothetical protein